MALYKNVASQKVAVYAHDTSADSAKTGDAANITAQVSKDGGATAASNDTNPTELDATDAPGIYIFDLTQAETNCDLCILYAQSSTADVQIEPVVIYTLPGDSSAVDANATEVSGSSTAADNAEVVFATDFATNYSTANDKWQTEADMVAISGDSTAADNAESAFDGTGYGFAACTMPTVTALTNAVTLADGAHGGGSTTITLSTPIQADVRQGMGKALMKTGTVDSTNHAPTTTEFEADDITEATDDHFNDRVVIFTSGALLQQATRISDYTLTSGRGHFTVDALTEAPGNDDTFVII